MSVNSELDKIEDIKVSIYNAIKNQNVNIAADTPFEDYPLKVSSISGGGGSGYPYNNFSGNVTSQGGVSYMNTSILYDVLPDYSMYTGTSQFCLMPYNQVEYEQVPVLDPNANPYLIVKDCIVENGIARGFSNTNYLKIDRDLNYNTLEITLKVLLHTTDYNCVLVADSTARTELSVHSGGTIAFWDTSYFYGSTTFKLDTYYYVRVVIENGVSTLYTLEDTGYTFSTLPPLNSWTKEYEYSGVIFSNKVSLGYDVNYPEEYTRGNIDLNNSKIKSGNTVIWEYPQAGLATKSLQGCLMYEDDGLAATVGAYCINGNHIVLSKGQPSIVGATVLDLGNVSVPVHDLYSYSKIAQPTDYTEFVKYGSVSLDTISGVASDFSTSNYLRLETPINEIIESWDICFKVTVPDGSITEYGRVLNSGMSDDNLSFSVGSNGISFILYNTTSFQTSDISRGTYYVRCIGESGTGTLYISTDGISWVEKDTRSYSFSSLLEIPFFDLGCRTRDSYGPCVFSGAIDLSESYIKINDQYIYNNVKDVVTWTKL